MRPILHTSLGYAWLPHAARKDLPIRGPLSRVSCERPVILPGSIQRVKVTSRPASWSHCSPRRRLRGEGSLYRCGDPQRNRLPARASAFTRCLHDVARADPGPPLGSAIAPRRADAPTLSDRNRARRPGGSGNDRAPGAAGELDDPGPVDRDLARDGILDLGGLLLERTVSCVRGTAGPILVQDHPVPVTSILLDGGRRCRVRPQRASSPPRSSRPTGATSPATTSTVIPSTSLRHTEHPAPDQVVSS